MMSANTYWRPATKGKFLDCPSSFLDVVADAKGLGRLDDELALNGADVPILKGIAAADKFTREVVEQLIDAIERHGTIYVWREY